MKSTNSQRLILFIFFAGLLSACDPLAYPFLSADHIVFADDTAYLHATERASWGIGYSVEDPDHYFVSVDYGKTWHEVASPPVEMPPAIADVETVKSIACAPNDVEICYRIAGIEQVEISEDGGNTWQVDWKMPSGREKYMAKNPAMNPFFRIEPETVPYDLAIIPAGNQDHVIVALGNQGVLVKSTSGSWERYAVAPAEPNRLAFPLPFYAMSFNAARLALRTETIWALLAAFIFLVSLSVVGWKKLFSNIDQNFRSKVIWSGAPFILAVAGFLCLIFLIVVDLFAPIFLDVPGGNTLSGLSYDLSWLVCLIPVIGLVISWLLVPFISPNRKAGLLAAAVALGYALIFIVGVLFPLMLWAFGLIPWYEIALILALIFGVLSLYFGFRHEKRVAVLATGQENAA